MKTLAIALLATLPLLAACSERDNAAGTSGSTKAGASKSDSMIGREVREAMDEARAELATENISLGDLHVSGNGKGISITTSDDNGNHPKAELTPRGELLIDGRKVEANAEQRALLLQYRKQVETIASAGMDIGAAGAELGVKAATAALKGIFSGNTDDIEQRVEAEAGKIEVSARKLCDQLPAMLDIQTRLAATMPEFRPYATLDQSDIDECYEDHHVDSAQIAAEVSAEVGKEVRESVGAAMGVDASDSGDADMNAAAEAEAASEESVN